MNIDKLKQKIEYQNNVIESMSKCINNLRFRPYHSELGGVTFSNAKEVERHFRNKVKLEVER